MIDHSPSTEGNKSSLTREILEKFQPTSKNLCFSYDSMRGITIDVYNPVDLMSDDEAIEFFKKIRPNAANFFGNLDPSEKEQYADEARHIKRSEKIGFPSITNRSLSDLEELIPGLTAHAMALGSQDRLVFTGNGLSQAAIELIQRYTTAQLPLPEIIVADIFDYHQLLSDLQRLKVIFASQKIPLPSALETYLQNCTVLVEYIDTKKLTAISYMFGNQMVPEEMKNSSLVVSAFGPPPSTLAEQISLLKKDGVLFISERGLPQTMEANISEFHAGKESYSKVTKN